MQKRSAKKDDTGSAATKKACMGTACDSKTSKPAAARVEEEDTTNVFSHDLDTLQCDICFMPFESQIYMCKNGHAACGNCCVRLQRKCPSCNESTGDIWCRAMEKILAGMTRPCKFKKHGCEHILRFSEIRTHEEETCRYAPCPCPFDHMLECGHGPFFELDSLGRLALTLDKSTPLCVLLYPDGDESVFLLLNGGDVPTWRSLSVVRLYPRPDEEYGAGAVPQQYTMVVEGDVPARSLSLTFGTVQFVRCLKGHKRREFLFLPDACWGSSRTVTVNVTVYP